MSVTPEQFNEMSERTEKARKESPEEASLRRALEFRDKVILWNALPQIIEGANKGVAEVRETIERTERARKKPVLDDGYAGTLTRKAAEGMERERLARRHLAITPVEKDILAKLNEQKETQACYICGEPVTDNARVITTDLSRVRHVDCLSRQLKEESGSVRLVLDFWASEGVPRPQTEWKFCDERKFRMDFAWPFHGFVFLEVQGALFGTGKKCPTCGQRKAGRHTRGPALLKEQEKLNLATELLWRPLFCTPSDLLTVKLTQTIKRALKL